MSDVPQTNGALTTRFKPGNPGGGRKRGSKNKASLFWAKIETGVEDAQAIVTKLVEMAKGGDQKAMDLYLARVWVPRRNRIAPITLPNITDAAGLAAAYQAVAQALSLGIIDPDEAVKISALLEGQRKNLEGSDVLQRIKALEARRGEVHE